MSSAYTREQRPTLRSAVSGQRYALQPPLRDTSQERGPSALPIESVSGLYNPRTKNRQPHDAQRLVSTVAVAAAGTTTLLVDAPRTCRRPRALLRGHASKSGQTRLAPRDCTSPATTSTRPVPPVFTRSAMSSGSRFCLCATGL